MKVPVPKLPLVSLPNLVAHHGFSVNSPGLVTTGTTGADSFLVESAARGATINGLAGNDTVNLTAGGGASADEHPRRRRRCSDR